MYHPAVILLVNDMKEIEHKNRKSFIAIDVTVSVTCKPKKIYPSSATNWANDMVAVRLMFREEHEVPSTEVNFCDIPKHLFLYVICLRDSLMQFQLMTIPEDYMRVGEGGDYLAREQLRVSVLLLQRLATAIETLQPAKGIADLETLLNGITELETLLQAVGKEC